MPNGKRRQRGSIERRGNSFRVSVYAGLDPITGKRIFLRDSTTDGRKAERILIHLLAQVDSQRHARSKATLGYALDEWLRVQELESSTRETYVLAALPKSAHPGAKKALSEIFWNAEDRQNALDAVKAFEAAYGAKFPKPSPRSPTMSTTTGPSTTIPPSTGYTCAPRIPSSRPSRRCGTGPRSPRGRARGRPGWPWRSSSSSPPKPDF